MKLYDLLLSQSMLCDRFKEILWHSVYETPTRYDVYLVKTKQGCLAFALFDMDGWHIKDNVGGEVEKWFDLYYIIPIPK